MQYAAVGAGVHYAMGALYATEQLDISEPDRVVLACKAAITHDKYCNGGVDMIRVPA
jgi:ATP-dependent protease HslVU (ClpYQ) peptidase subunit